MYLLGGGWVAAVSPVLRHGAGQPRGVQQLRGERVPVPQVPHHQLRREGSLPLQQLWILQVGVLCLVFTVENKFSFFNIEPCTLKSLFSWTLPLNILGTLNKNILILEFSMLHSGSQSQRKSLILNERSVYTVFYNPAWVFVSGMLNSSTAWQPGPAVPWTR